jgi:hypothetical protein
MAVFSISWDGQARSQRHKRIEGIVTRIEKPVAENDVFR